MPGTFHKKACLFKGRPVGLETIRRGLIDVLGGHLAVDINCCADVPMPEDCLHLLHGSSCFQEVVGQAVPKSVERPILFHWELVLEALYQALYLFTSERRSDRVDEYRFARMGCQMRFHKLNELWNHFHGSIKTIFGATQVNEPGAEIYVWD